MKSLRNPYGAVVVGARGGLGRAFVEQLRADPACAQVAGLARAGDPEQGIPPLNSLASTASGGRRPGCRGRPPSGN